MKTTWIVTGLVFLLFLPCSPAIASPECDEGNTIERIECFNSYLDFAEKELKDAYRALVTLTKNSRNEISEKTLESAQKAWLEFREQNCKISSELDMTRYGFAYANCKLEMTNSRTAELKSFAQHVAKD